MPRLNMASRAALLLLMMLVVLSGPADGQTVFPELTTADGQTLFPSLNTPLCAAVEKGDLAAVQTLVEDKVDVNAACTFTESDYPLLVAAQYGQLEIGEVLLTSGADVNKAGFLGYTALLRAGEDLDPDFLELLLHNHADITASLIHMEGLDLNLGLDVLSLTTASYLRKSAFATQPDQEELDEDYASILDILYNYCFDFKDLGEASKTRLDSENHSAQALLVDDKINGTAAAGC